MSEFKSVKCDQCGRIQDGANHWLKMQVWEADGVLALGENADMLTFNDVRSDIASYPKRQERDLCGQGCAVKHIAKLLKWNIAERS
jgi:hypothetical protein